LNIYVNISGECSKTADQSTTIKCGDNAQLGGSQDTYNAPVDQSSNKTEIGDNAKIEQLQIGGIRGTISL